MKAFRDRQAAAAARLLRGARTDGRASALASAAVHAALALMIALGLAFTALGTAAQFL